MLQLDTMQEEAVRSLSRRVGGDVGNAMVRKSKGRSGKVHHKGKVWQILLSSYNILRHLVLSKSKQGLVCGHPHSPLNSNEIYQTAYRHPHRPLATYFVMWKQILLIFTHPMIPYPDPLMRT